MGLSIPELAKLLASHATERNPYHLVVDNDLLVNFPYYGRVRFFNCDPSELIHDETRLEAYHANTRIWSETLPTGWLKPLRRIQTERQKAGLTEAVDLHSALVLLIQNNDRARKRLIKLGIAVTAGEDNEYTEMFGSYEQICQLYEIALTDRTISSLLRPIAVGYIPYSSNIDYRVMFEILTDMPEQAIVLDAGCGDGANIAYVAEVKSQWTFHGVDYQHHPRDFVSWTNPKPNMHFHNSRLEQMPMFAAQMFDAVTMGGVCGHIDASRIAEVLTELARVLKHGGVIVVSPQEDHYNPMGDPFLMCAAYRLNADNTFDKIWP